MRGTGY